MEMSHEMMLYSRAPCTRKQLTKAGRRPLMREGRAHSSHVGLWQLPLLLVSSSSWHSLQLHGLLQSQLWRAATAVRPTTWGGWTHVPAVPSPWAHLPLPGLCSAHTAPQQQQLQLSSHPQRATQASDQGVECAVTHISSVP